MVLPSTGDRRSRLRAAAVEFGARGVRRLPRSIAQPLVAKATSIGRHAQPRAVTLPGGATIEAEPGTLIGWWLYTLGSYEPEVCALLRATCVTGGTAIDVGANIGVHSLEMAAAGVAVHAFEPHPLVFARLVRNVAVNPGLTISTHNVAVSAAPGMGWLSEPPESNDGMACLHPLGGWPQREVRLVSLDAFAREVQIKGLSMIKVDVEGHELPVLQGGETLIRRHRPFILFEYVSWAWEAAGQRFADAERLLSEWQYRLFAVEGDRLRRLTRGPVDDGNLLAVPLARPT